jgi:H+-translocating NAD(P) transhydrogenase subunit beta
VLDIIIGSITFTGSLVASGKLQGLIPGKPILIPGGRIVTAGLAAITLVAALILFATGTPSLPLMLLILAAALIFGVTMTLPIGGADMPVVISLLNSFTGTAVAMAGFVIDNPVLIIAGALVGASGAILTKLMADAMNRSVVNIMVGGFGGGDEAAGAAGAGEGGSVRSISPDDVAIQLAYAQHVIVVPGYGLAVAQAQHAVRELADLLEERGVDVKYAIHPVAGRMPGHMNVLLAEANVPYPQLKEMDDINPEFDRADVALVIGANDVTNPAARRPGSPVSGMPILDVDHAKSIVVIKRSMGRGYAGIDNELYTNEKTGMLFADAKEGLAALTAAVKAL